MNNWSTVFNISHVASLWSKLRFLTFRNWFIGIKRRCLLLRQSTVSLETHSQVCIIFHLHHFLVTKSNREFFFLSGWPSYWKTWKSVKSQEIFWDLEKSLNRQGIMKKKWKSRRIWRECLEGILACSRPIAYSFISALVIWADRHNIEDGDLEGQSTISPRLTTRTCFTSYL